MFGSTAGLSDVAGRIAGSCVTERTGPRPPVGLGEQARDDACRVRFGRAAFGCCRLWCWLRLVARVERSLCAFGGFGYACAFLWVCVSGQGSECVEIGFVGQGQGFDGAAVERFEVVEFELVSASFDERVDVPLARVEAGHAECAGLGCSPGLCACHAVDEDGFEDRVLLGLGEAV